MQKSIDKLSEMNKSLTEKVLKLESDVKELKKQTNPEDIGYYRPKRSRRVCRYC